MKTNARMVLVIIFAAIVLSACKQQTESTAEASSSCSYVALNDLANTPFAYDNRLICTQGTLVPNRGGWLLVNTTFDPSSRNFFGIQVLDEDGSRLLHDWVTQDHVEILGEFQVDELCWRLFEEYEAYHSGSLDSIDTANDELAWNDCLHNRPALRIIASDLTLTARSFQPGECVSVPLTDLVGRPEDYSDVPICTEGIINVAYESMGIYPETGVPLPFHGRKLGPGMNAHNASEAGFRSGDHVRAVGTFAIDWTCFGPDTLCPGGDTNSFYLRDSEVELTSPIAPSDVCEHFSLEDLPSDITSPAPRVVCTSGQYRNDGEGGHFLVPEQYAGSLDGERDFYLNYIWFGADVPDIADGAWVEVVAVQFANELTVYDIVAENSAGQ